MHRSLLLRALFAFPLLLLAFLLTSCRENSLSGYEPREGDIIFQSLPHNELVDAIEGTTRSPWSHCGLLVNRNGAWHVAEALGTVHETKLVTFVARGRSGQFAIYRPKTLNAGQAARLAAAVSTFNGLPYDYRYAPDDTEIYCSELVYKAYDRALGLKIGEWQKLGELDWRPFESFIRKMENGALPLDRPMITPAALTRSPLLENVFPKN